MGISWDDFWKMNPHIIKLVAKGHEEKIKEQDAQLYTMGMYVLSAVSVAVEHCLSGKKAKSQYVEKPFLSEMQEKQKEEISEEKRIEMENYKLAMTLQIMQANFEINKEKRNQGGIE